MAISDQETTTFVQQTMTAFADRTGLTGKGSPVRYLWTDAFAVCNFLELERLTGDGAYRDLALCLVDQVHHVLGRHRSDDLRTGWISGLAEEAGETHPTQGGLRIGKAMTERRARQPLNEALEWDRDGQYFHYLTRWMHALGRVARVTGERRYLRWAIELAVTACDRFSYLPETGGKRRMYWKMSIDLSRPLLDAMGQHDPLDGLVTLTALRAAAEELEEPAGATLEPRIGALSEMLEAERLATPDPLGIGGLLSCAYLLVQLQAAGSGLSQRTATLLDAALPGLEHQGATPDFLSQPADLRLAFRELGLCIGLRAVRTMQEMLSQSPASFRGAQSLLPRLARLARFAPLVEAIESFWLSPANRDCTAWREHQDINAVMLATALAPDGYLER